MTDQYRVWHFRPYTAGDTESWMNQQESNGFRFHEAHTCPDGSIWVFMSRPRERKVRHIRPNPYDEDENKLIQ